VGDDVGKKETKAKGKTVRTMRKSYICHVDKVGDNKVMGDGGDRVTGEETIKGAGNQQ